MSFAPVQIMQALRYEIVGMGGRSAGDYDFDYFDDDESVIGFTSEVGYNVALVMRLTGDNAIGLDQIMVTSASFVKPVLFSLSDPEFHDKLFAFLRLCGVLPV